MMLEIAMPKMAAKLVVLELKLAKTTDFSGMIKDFSGISCIWLSLEKPEGFCNQLLDRLGHAEAKL